MPALKLHYVSGQFAKHISDDGNFFLTVWDMMKADPQTQKHPYPKLAGGEGDEGNNEIQRKEVLMYRQSAESYPNTHFSLGVQARPTSGLQVVSPFSSTGGLVEV